MKKYVISSLAALGVASNAQGSVVPKSTSKLEYIPDWVKNFLSDELPFELAGHRSHSSHSSHSSHRSSGSSGVSRSAPSSQSTPPTSTLPPKPTLKGTSSAFLEVAKKVQIQLMIDNLYRGSIDGIVGPKTREAIMKYQRIKGLPITGKIDSALLLSMKIR